MGYLTHTAISLMLNFKPASFVLAVEKKNDNKNIIIIIIIIIIIKMPFQQTFVLHIGSMRQL